MQKAIVCLNSRPEKKLTPQLPFGNEEVKFFDNAEVGQRIVFIRQVFLILQRSLITKFSASRTCGMLKIINTVIGKENNAWCDNKMLDFTLY